MAKKPTKKDKDAKKARMAERNAKVAAKSDNKDKKKSKKNAGSDDEDDIDIDEILAQYAREQAAFQAVTITTTDKGPSKRINATMVPSPIQGKRELFLFGGETTEKKDIHTGSGQTIPTTLAVFYNELYHYSIDTDQWRIITSPNSPLPRSGHAMCAHPSGVILVFGGEFSSPKQNTFYHYGDTWILDAETKEWTKLDIKKGPSSRSGHRMTVWKNYILLHGGFRDLGTTSMYLNDLWAFDITSYKWHQIAFPTTYTIPDARSGHSFLAHPEGGVIWGGYSKVKGVRGIQKGKVHTDSWLLKMKPDLTGVRWERRKKAPYAPSPRVGCSMTYHRGRGILFGGVFDQEETEESLTSTFYNDLYAYQVDMNKWFALKLRAPRKRIAQAQAQNRTERRENRDADLESTLSKILEGKLDLENDSAEKPEASTPNADEQEEEIKIKDYPVVAVLPHPRYNVTSTVVDDILFLFGGGYEYKEKEYHLDSMYSIDLGKLDGCKVYWEDLSELANKDEEEEDDDEDEEWEEDEEEDEDMGDTDEEEAEEADEEEPEKDEDEVPDDRPWLPHPKPFENLREFYARTCDELIKWAMSQDRDARGKDLKRVAFDLAEDRWWERREVLRVQEDKLEELGGIGNVIEKDTSKPKGRR